MSNVNTVKRLHKADNQKDDIYSLAVKGDEIGTVTFDLAYQVMLGRMSPAEAVEKSRGSNERK